MYLQIFRISINVWYLDLKKITLTVVILYSSFVVAEKRYCCSKKNLITYRTASTEKRCRRWTKNLIPYRTASTEKRCCCLTKNVKPYRTASAKVRCCCLTKQEGPFCKIADLRMKWMSFGLLCTALMFIYFSSNRDGLTRFLRTI